MNKTTCPICGSLKEKDIILNFKEDAATHKAENIFIIAKCQECAISFLQPQPSPNELQNYYPEFYWRFKKSSLAPLENFIVRKLFFSEIKEIKNILQERKNIDEIKLLDIGCGAGEFLNSLTHLKIKLYGIDNSENAIKIALQNNNLIIKKSNIIEEPLFEFEYFDIITLFHTLEHLSDPNKAIQNIKNILKRDGFLIIQVPNIECLLFKITKRHWAGLHIPQHLFHFSKKSLQNFLSNNNFRIVKIKDFSLRSSPAQVVVSFFPFLNPIYLRERILNRHLLLICYLFYFLLLIVLFPLSLIEGLMKRGNTITIIARRSRELENG